MSGKFDPQQLETEEQDPESGSPGSEINLLRCKLLGLPPDQMEFRIEVNYTQRISEIKALIRRKLNLQPLRIQLIFKGKVVEDNVLLSELDIHRERDFIMVMGLMEGA